MSDVEKKRKRRVSSKAVPKQRKAYDKIFRLTLVKMYVEDGHSVEMLSEESGVSKASLNNWIKMYREHGEAGLETKRHGQRLRKDSHPLVDQKIIELKKENPSFGIRRISDILRQWHFLPTNKDHVHAVLKEAELQQKPKRKRQRNVEKPRRFERSSPNQMWQSDIMMFRMGGRQLYLIGFIDDYSRYITGMGLYMSQTADNLIELYRRATAEYAVPKEMLTDNGRQYVNWRGESKFQKELKKDRVKHIRSTPHHPMTLGKIERFWQTIFEEFLSKAQFDSFETARERIALWVKYYNHKRPHQGIESLCPADRFFEISNDVRKTVEAGIKDNLLELALRGKPKEPFYLVGRMDGQSVVMRAEKGLLKLTVDNAPKVSGIEQAFVIDKEKEDANGGAGRIAIGTDTADGIDKEKERDSVTKLYGSTEGGSSAEGLVGATDTCSDLSGLEHNMDYFKSVAGTGSGRDVTSTGATSTPGEGGSTKSPITGHAGEETRSVYGREVEEATSQIRRETIGWRMRDGEFGEAQRAAFSGHLGAEPKDECNRWSEDTGSVPQDLLRMGRPGIGCDAGGSDRSPSRSPADGSGRGEGGVTEGDRMPQDRAGACEENHSSKDHPDRLRTATEIAIERLGRKAG